MNGVLGRVQRGAAKTVYFLKILGIPPGQPVARAGIAIREVGQRLTPRESQILALVAEGLTTRQIADMLVISPRTVNTHLTSIYAKIQVSSRSAATAYALAHHLV